MMMAAFTGSPFILRFHGDASVVLRERDMARYDELKSHFQISGAAKVDDFRSIIVMKCQRIFSSCGYGVPLMNFEDHRDTLSGKLALINDPKILHPKSKLPVLDDVKRLNAMSVDGFKGPYRTTLYPEDQVRIKPQPLGGGACVVLMVLAVGVVLVAWLVATG